MSFEDLVLGVEEGEQGRYRVLPDGRHAYEAKVTLSEKGFEMLRTGYLCGRCLQDLTELGAFPERCPVCGFRVRELQLQQLQQDHVGSEELGSRLSLSDELERMRELWLPSE